MIASAPATPPRPHPIPDPYARLCELYRENEGLGAKLRALDFKSAEALDYLYRSDANIALGVEVYKQVRDKRAQIIATVRANRIEAGKIIGGPDA